jgi:hypothetical protein
MPGMALLGVTPPVRTDHCAHPASRTYFRSTAYTANSGGRGCLKLPPMAVPPETEPPETEPPKAERPDRQPPQRDDRYAALGQVVEMAAVLEVSLRMAFCALMGSEHAAVVAAAQETHWLIESCEALAHHRSDLSAADREALSAADQEGIAAALRACRVANHDRNRLVHEAWGTGADGEPVEIGSIQGTYRIGGRAWSVAEIQAAADAIGSAQQALLAAIEAALGPESLHRAETQLRNDASAPHS